MKKGLKITGIVIGALLLILVLLPFAFKGKIKDIVISEGNKMLNAEFNIETLNISFIRNFPYATVTIKDFDLWGKDDFAGDTLVSADRLSATMNIMSLFGKDGYEINRVILSGVDVKAIVLEDGRPNWDIMKPSQQEDEEKESDSAFEIELKKVNLDKVNIIYDDRQGGTYASLNDLSLVLSGDLSSDHTTLKIESGIEQLYLRNNGLALLNNVKVRVKGNIDADLDKMIFTLKKNAISINAINASIDGSVAMLDDEAMDIDLRLNTEKIGFKELLSMIPAVYAKDFKSLQANGDVKVAAWVKGRLVGEILPAFDVNIDVTNGSFRYPALPKGVDNINVAASAKSPGGTVDAVVVDVNPMNLTIAGNPFSATIYLTNIVSDPTFAITAKGLLDAGMIKEVYPLEDVELNGIFNANIDLKGRMSYVEKEQYDKFLASGTLGIKNMIVKLKDMPDVDIKNSLFTFTPQSLNLSETTVNIGGSDITADSRFENYMAFLSKGQVVRGSLNIRSNNLDLNEIMGGDPTKEGAEPQAAKEEGSEGGAVKAIKIPENINFNMNTNLKRVVYDNIVLDNVDGRITVSGGKLNMNNLSFNTLGGGVVANGYYSTAAGTTSPELNAVFNMNEVSFSQTFNTFVAIQKLAPIFENLKGNFSGNVSVNTRLDSLMNPVMSAMNGEGGLHTKNLNLSGIQALDRIADAVNYPQLKDINVKDMNIDFKIKEGRVHTTPFDIKMGNTNLNLSGSTGIDQTIDYIGKIALPESTGIGKYTTVNLKIGGTFDSPKVSIDTKGMAEQAVKSAVSQGLSEVGKKLGIDISNAEKQRETLIAQAQKTGEKLVGEAQKQADNLLLEAGDKKLAQVAAQIAGKKLVAEAQKQSDNLVRKATEEGDKLLERANKGETE